KNNFIYVLSPRAGFSVNTLHGCLDKAIAFTDSSVTTDGQNNIATWFWDFGDGQSQTFNAPLPLPVSHVYNTIGNFYPFLKIIDSVGCSDSLISSFPISIGRTVARFFSPNFNTCIGDTVVFRNAST